MFIHLRFVGLTKGLATYFFFQVGGVRVIENDPYHVITETKRAALSHVGGGAASCLTSNVVQRILHPSKAQGHSHELAWS